MKVPAFFDTDYKIRYPQEVFSNLDHLNVTDFSRYVVLGVTVGLDVVDLHRAFKWCSMKMIREAKEVCFGVVERVETSKQIDEAMRSLILDLQVVMSNRGFVLMLCRYLGFYQNGLLKPMTTAKEALADESGDDAIVIDSETAKKRVQRVIPTRDRLRVKVAIKALDKIWGNRCWQVVI